MLSKGHAAPALYAVGAHYGFCGKQASLALRKIGSPFQGHPHVLDLPWVETSTGSLGQGFSVALGMAMGLKLQKSPARVYALLGDGELQEGEVWEAAMCAAHHKLDNLLRHHRLQQAAERQRATTRSCGWSRWPRNGAPSTGPSPRSTVTTFGEILSTFRRAGTTQNRPSVIIAHTVKGKGVPYMENIPAWHGSVKLTREQAEDALQSLGATRNEIKELLDV